MQNSSYMKPLNLNFNAMDLLYIFIEVHRNALELQKMSKNVKKLELEGDWAKQV